MENKELVSKIRDPHDERIVFVQLTDKGWDLRNKAVSIPDKMAACVNLTRDEAATLYALLHKVMDINI